MDVCYFRGEIRDVSAYLSPGPGLADLFFLHGNALQQSAVRCQQGLATSRHPKPTQVNRVPNSSKSILVSRGIGRSLMMLNNVSCSSFRIRYLSCRGIYPCFCFLRRLGSGGHASHKSYRLYWHPFLSSLEIYPSIPLTSINYSLRSCHLPRSGYHLHPNRSLWRSK